MIRAVIKEESVIGKQALTRGRFNFATAILAEDHFGKGPYRLVTTDTGTSHLSHIIGDRHNIACCKTDVFRSVLAVILCCLLYIVKLQYLCCELPVYVMAIGTTTPWDLWKSFPPTL